MSDVFSSGFHVTFASFYYRDNNLSQTSDPKYHVKDALNYDFALSYFITHAILISFNISSHRLNFVSLLGAVRDLPGQDTDADDATVQCCGSEPYLSTHGICCKNVVTPFYPLKVNSKDSLQCCDDQGFNKRTSFCYSCGSKKHVLPVSEENSWKCCKDQEIYRDKEFRCCDYGVEKGQQCKSHACYYTGVDP